MRLNCPYCARGRTASYLIFGMGVCKQHIQDAQHDFYLAFGRHFVVEEAKKK
jgi:hypothetical protein